MTNTPDPLKPDDAEVTKIMVAELQRLYGRIEGTNDSTTSVIQFIVLVFGAAFLAATKYSEAIVAMPIFWTVWMLYALMTDYNTLKYSVVATHLEGLINDRLAMPVFAWESKMAERTNKRPLLFWANYILWAVLNASAWVIGIVVTFGNGYDNFGYLLVALWAAAWGVGIFTTIVRRSYYLGTFRDALTSGASLTTGAAAGKTGE